MLLGFVLALAAMPAAAGILIEPAPAGPPGAADGGARQQTDGEPPAEAGGGHPLVALIADADAVHALLARHVPGMVAPPLDRAALVADPPACAAGGAPPRTRAILVGAVAPHPSQAPLAGPENDVGLLAASLAARGVRAADVAVLTGAAATGQRLAAAMAGTLAETRCGDQVLLYFGGYAGRYEDMAWAVRQVVGGEEAYAPLKRHMEEPPAGPKLEALRDPHGVCGGDEDCMAEVSADLAALDSFARARSERLYLLLNNEDESFLDVVPARMINDYVTAVRNRAADIAVILDTSYASLADVAGHQRRVDVDRFWRRDTGPPPDQPDGGTGEAALTLLPDHGDFAALYSSIGDSNSTEIEYDRGDGGKKTFGVFTFRLAAAIQNRDGLTVRALAESLQAEPDAEPDLAGGTQRYRAEASDPDLVLLSGTASLPQRNPIVVTRPAPKRGAAAVERPEIAIEGFVDGASPVGAVVIDGAVATLDRAGRFAHTARLKTGLNTIGIVALMTDGRIHERRLDILYEGDKTALEGEGRRYAVVIANQNYAPQTGFESLTTPFADADALTEVLAARYGFLTELTDPGGRRVPLVLKDASARDIQATLHHVGLAVGEKDTVLIYYAGHGEYEQSTTNAYWIPADAQHRVPFTYLSAAAISDAVSRMQAGNVVLISDSCFSGAMMRGGAGGETVEAGEERMRALLKMAERRSRILISSGGNEPVDDLGGDGHSVFARALLTGLREMEADAFSARELFDRYILQAVAANADQEPQYRPIHKVGHEGGDVVFVRRDGG
ncbi:caspase family protein [Aquibium sp. A9E412]|uniref:caspase family protein n=1 Tax=Aquibium sp. A9E412 TaxID=2976767 RepID=UPI0025B20864|nr:caspase family protein [Aquibium sp. A9E412]MDN2565929.1 caspase family protein [Aquibium sp. A9E412]